MTFTDAQLAALAAYERNFLTAIRGKWALNPGGDAVRLIHSILTQATGQQRPLNTGCGTCLLHLLQDCGALYFADVEERAKAAARVSADAKPRKTRKAVTVKAKEDEA